MMETIVASIAEVCRYIDNYDVIEMITTKGIDGEPAVKIRFRIKEEES